MERLLALADRLPGQPVLVPIDDRGAVLVADHQEKIREAFRIPQPAPGAVRALASKRELHELCLRLGLPAARTSFPQSRDEALSEIAEATFPLVLKRVEGSLPAAGAEARSVVIAASAGEERIVAGLDDIGGRTTPQHRR